MVRLLLKSWLIAPIMLCMCFGLAISAKAEIRSKSSGSSSMKPTAKKPTPPKEDSDRGPQTAPADHRGDSRAGDQLADDDSPTGASIGKNPKDKVKKKTAKKRAAETKSSAGGRSGRPRKVEPPQNQQGIVAPELDLEPET